MLYLLNPPLWAERLMGRTILWLRAEVPEERIVTRILIKKTKCLNSDNIHALKNGKMFHEKQYVHNFRLFPSKKKKKLVLYLPGLDTEYSTRNVADITPGIR